MASQAKGKGKMQPEPSRDQDGWTVVGRRKGVDADFQLDPADWNAPVVSYDKLAAEIDNNADATPFRAVVLCSSGQAAVATTMARGSSHTCCITLIVLDKAGEASIPGKVAGQRRFMKGHLTEVSTKGGKAPQIQGKSKAVVVPKTDTTVLFVRLPRIFAEPLWRSWKQKASAGLMSWAAKYQLTIVDAWGWKEQRTEQGVEQLYGLIRAEKSQLESILCRSGTEGVFVEPSRRDLKTRVEWLPGEKGEAHAAHLERACRARKELGLATCGNSLGVRHSLQSSDRVQRQWTLRGAPSNGGCHRLWPCWSPPSRMSRCSAGLLEARCFTSRQRRNLRLIAT